MSKRVKASEIVEWRGPCSFIPHDDGHRASLQAWSPTRKPGVGTVIGLRGEDGKPAAYRVVEYVPSHMAAEYDGWMIRLEFVPGREIEDDR